MSKALEEFRNTLNEYSSNEENIKNFAEFEANENLQQFLGKAKEKFQEALAIPQAVLGLNQSVRAVKAIYNKVRGKPKPPVEDDVGEEPAESGSANVLEQEGFTEDDLTGSDMFDGDVEMQNLSEPGFTDDIERPEADPDVDTLETDFADTDFGMPRNIGTEVGGLVTQETEGISEGITQGLSDASELVSGVTSGISEGVSTALSTAGEVLGTAGEVLGPIGDIASIGTLIGELVTGPSEAQPIKYVDVTTPNYNDLTVSASYSSTRNEPQQAIF